MDKYENKVKIEEIKSLVASGAYEDAADIADTINWATIKNIQTLGLVSDLYKKLQEYEQSRNVLTYAYERQKSKPVIKSMCELSIVLSDLVGALKYYNEYKELAPKDPISYMLQYKLYKAQNISLEEQIGVLEILKELDYQDRWAFELATLYHKAGLGSQCVRECDDIILWFVDGKYVLKAYELKSQHAKLTEQEIFNYELIRQAGGELNIQYSLRDEAKPKQEKKELEIGSDVSPYNTQNLQAVVAEGIQDVLDGNLSEAESGPAKPETYEEAVAMDEEQLGASFEEEGDDLLVTQMYNPVIPEEPVGQELEESQEEVEVKGNNLSDTDIIGDVAKEMASDLLTEGNYSLNKNTDEMKVISSIEPQSDSKEEKSSSVEAQPSYQFRSDLSNTGIIETFHKSSNMDEMLSQEYDGQISFVVPEEPVIEKQITGQISIDDVMQEWERKKKENEEKLVKDIKDQVKKETYKVLERFDKATQDSLLSKIEDAVISAALEEEKERQKMGRPQEIKVKDIEAMDHTGEIATKIVEQALAEDQAEKAALEEKRKAEQKKAEEIKRAWEEKKAQDAKIAEQKKALREESDEEKPEKKDEEEFEEIEEIQETQEEDDSYDEEQQINETDKSEEETTENEEESAPVSQSKKLSDKRSYSGDTKGRDLNKSEQEQFAAFAHHRSTQKQIANVLDNVSMASYTGNVLVTSEEIDEITVFSKLLIQEIANCDGNFTGKVAITSGEKLNYKDIADSLDKVKNGALIISEPEGLKKKTVDSLLGELEKEGLGVVVIMQGRADIIDKIVEQNPGVGEVFNLRVDLKAFDNKTLAEYAKKYAYEQEYGMDELAVLALHTRISDLQTADHEVTLSEIEDIVDEAIYYADKKTPKHFFDILIGKRYDSEDMIVLREKDFMHY